MTYTVNQENLSKVIELLALLNCDIREMERKHGSMVANITTYNTKTEKLLDEECIISMLLGLEIADVDKMVSTRTHELELAQA